MKHKHILIFGATGQLGAALQRRLALSHRHAEASPAPIRRQPLIPPRSFASGFCPTDADAAAHRITSISRMDADLARPMEIRAAIRGALPDIIINAAAYTDIDGAEAEPELAEKINADAVAVMAEESARRSAVLIHFSSDCVFDGRKPEPYVETDEPRPLSVYGRSRRDGEIFAARYPRHFIFRTSWLWSATHRCFPRTILNLAKRRASLRVVEDMVGTPTPASLVAQVTAQVLAQLDTTPAYGTYHLSAAGAANWNGFARHILARAREKGITLAAGPENVAQISAADWPRQAIRPTNALFCCEKLSRTFGITLPDWRTAAAPELDEILARKFPARG